MYCDPLRDFQNDKSKQHLAALTDNSKWLVGWDYGAQYNK